MGQCAKKKSSRGLNICALCYILFLVAALPETNSSSGNKRKRCRSRRRTRTGTWQRRNQGLAGRLTRSRTLLLLKPIHRSEKRAMNTLHHQALPRRSRLVPPPPEAGPTGSFSFSTSLYARAFPTRWSRRFTSLGDGTTGPFFPGSRLQDIGTLSLAGTARRHTGSVPKAPRSHSRLHEFSRPAGSATVLPE